MCYFSGFVCITGCDNPRNPVMLPSIDQLLSGAREFYSWQMAEWALRHVWRYNITLNLHEDCCSFLADFHLPHLISPECLACAWVWPVKPHYRDVTMSHCFLWPDVTTVTRPSWHSLPRHLLSRVTHRAPVHRVSWELRSRPVNIIMFINILTNRRKEWVDVLLRCSSGHIRPGILPLPGCNAPSPGSPGSGIIPSKLGANLSTNKADIPRYIYLLLVIYFNFIFGYVTLMLLLIHYTRVNKEI